jgi:hypothetical protein
VHTVDGSVTPRFADRWHGEVLICGADRQLLVAMAMAMAARRPALKGRGAVMLAVGRGGVRDGPTGAPPVFSFRLQRELEWPCSPSTLRTLRTGFTATQRRLRLELPVVVVVVAGFDRVHGVHGPASTG